MHRRHTRSPWFPTYSPLSFDLNYSPVTKIATVSQTANAVSLGGFAVASNVAEINQ